jgi:predicted transcriptional regulator
MMVSQMMDEQVSKYTDRKLTVIDSNIKVSEAAHQMVKSDIDSFLVSENDDIVGIVTNKDILSDVVAKGKDPSKVSVKEIARKPLIKIQKESTVKDAILLMNKHNIRRLLVADPIKPIGIITQKMIIGNLGKYATPLPMLEAPSHITCPYCLSKFDDKQVMSKHIDDIHIGRGLLEGVFEGNLAQKV